MESNLVIKSSTSDLQLFKEYFENNQLIIQLNNIDENINLNEKDKYILQTLNNVSNFLRNKNINEVRINLEDLVRINEAFDFFFYNLRYYNIMGDNLFLYTFNIINLNKLFGKKLNINDLNNNKFLPEANVVNGGKKKNQKGGMKKSYFYTIFLFFIFFLQAGYSKMSLPLNKSLVHINSEFSKELVTINVNKKNLNTSLSVLYNEINQKQKINAKENTNEFNVFDFIKTNYLFFSYFLYYLVLERKSIKYSFVKSYNNVYVNEKTKKNPLYKSLKDYLLKPKEEKKNKQTNTKCPKCLCKCECEFNKK